MWMPFWKACRRIRTPGIKVRGETYGYYILRYVGDEAEGPVDYESVKESLHNALLTSKQNTTYSDTLTKWVEEAGIKEDLGALKN